VVSLRPITDANRAAVEALSVTPAQERFVSSVSESLLEAAAEPDGRAISWAIYSDETPVGFVMISDDVGSPDYIPEAADRRAPPAPGPWHGDARPGRRVLPRPR
jgi:hypothetical protein